MHNSSTLEATQTPNTREMVKPGRERQPREQCTAIHIARCGTEGVVGPTEMPSIVKMSMFPWKSYRPTAR